MLKFDEDDEFEGVIAYFQGAFALQNGVLHMKGFSGNAPLVPVCSWPEFHALRGILKTELSHRLLFRNGEEKMEWDVVLVDMPSISALESALTRARSILT